MRTQILEQQVKFGKTVADGCTTEEGGTKVTTGILLNSSDGIHQVTSTLAALRITQTSHTAVPCRKCQILESLAFINKNVVYTHRLEINDIIPFLIETEIDLIQF